MSYQTSFHAYGHTSRQRKRFIIFTTAVIITAIGGYFVGAAIEKINRVKIESSYQKEIDRLEREVDHLRMLGGFEKTIYVSA